jgi:hypothetical protein
MAQEGRILKRLMAMPRIGRKASQRGQVTLEFTIIVPLFMGILFLGLALAAGWHVHHLSASLSLEGSSLEAATPGYGMGFVITTGKRVAPSTSLTTEVAEYPYAWLSGDGVRGQRFTILGNVHLPWTPLGINLESLLRGTAYVPVWEFNGSP